MRTSSFLEAIRIPILFTIMMWIIVFVITAVFDII